MKNVLLAFSILIVTGIANATPATMDYTCTDNAGTTISWDTIQGNEDSKFHSINGHINITVQGEKVSISPERVLASPRRPLLLMRSGQTQYIIATPSGRVVDNGDEILSAAHVEFAIQGAKGLIRLKKTLMSCHGANDA